MRSGKLARQEFRIKWCGFRRDDLFNLVRARSKMMPSSFQSNEEVMDRSR